MDFLDKAQIDKFVGIGSGRFGAGGREKVEITFHAICCRQGGLRQDFAEGLIGSVETVGVGDAGVFTDRFDCRRPVALEAMDRLDQGAAQLAEQGRCR